MTKPSSASAPAAGMLRKAKVAVRSRTSVSVVRRVQQTRGRIRDRQQRWFDHRHGVSTAGLVLLDELDVEGPTAADGNIYEPTWDGSIRRMIRSLHLDYQDFTFFDVGSGRGAVLLYASRFPFRRIRGVEHDRQLHETAVRNIAAYRSKRRKCADVESIWADALAVEIPDGPVVLFMSNPFKGETLERWLDHLARSLEADPRPVHLISFNAGIEETLDRKRWLRRTGGGWNHATYSGRSPAQPPSDSAITPESA